MSPRARVNYRTVIVDDDPDIRRMLQVILSRTWAFRVVGEYTDGQEALERLRAFINKPDLVLLDVLMPGMDGPTALPQIKTICPGTKVVGLTVVPERCKEEMPLADSCIDKGLVPADLVYRLYKVMRPETELSPDDF